MLCLFNIHLVVVADVLVYYAVLFLFNIDMVMEEIKYTLSRPPSHRSRLIFPPFYYYYVGILFTVFAPLEFFLNYFYFSQLGRSLFLK